MAHLVGLCWVKAEDLEVTAGELPYGALVKHGGVWVVLTVAQLRTWEHLYKGNIFITVNYLIQLTTRLATILFMHAFEQE